MDHTVSDGDATALRHSEADALNAKCAANGAALRDAVGAWRPDAGCIAAGDEHAGLALRCWAAAGLSNEAIRLRFLDCAGPLDVPEPPVIEPGDAARAFALHATLVGLPPEEIARQLGVLATSIPGWLPSDADEIAALIEIAHAEVGPSVASSTRN